MGHIKFKYRQLARWYSSGFAVVEVGIVEGDLSEQINKSCDLNFDKRFFVKISYIGPSSHGFKKNHQTFQ